MPIHDWTRVADGKFHDFHTVWIGAIRSALNRGVLPPSHYAEAQAAVGPYESDVLTFRESSGQPPRGAAATLPAIPPRLMLERPGRPASVRRRVEVRRVDGDQIVAIIEIVSRGNKKGSAARGEFAGKCADVVRQGIHLLVVDLLPPRGRDRGTHPAIWRALTGERLAPTPDETMLLASYQAGRPVRAFVEPTAVGRELFAMPLCLAPGLFVSVPLEPTYLEAFGGAPAPTRQALEA